ncbi:MAG: 5' nucleotidase, NT5C type [Candidatus Micrarchaeia archaeon]
MEKRRIGIDIDNTLANTQERLQKVVSERGLSLNKDTYDLSDALGINNKKVNELFKEVWSKPNDIKPMPGAVETVQGLHAKFEIVIVTSNHQADESTLKSWLTQNSIPYDEFHVVAKPLKKPDYGLFVLIEDYGEVALEQVNRGGFAILIRWPYNEAYAGKSKLLSMCTWNEVSGKVKEMEMVARQSELAQLERPALGNKLRLA